MLTKFCLQDDQPDHLQLLSLFKQQVELISMFISHPHEREV